MSFEYMNANQLDNYYGMQGVRIIDLRESAEYERGHFASAINIPYKQMEKRLEDMERQMRQKGYERETRIYGEEAFDKNMLYIFYCARGSLSMMICSKMAAMGFRAKTVVGGIRRYRGRNILIDT